MLASAKPKPISDTGTAPVRHERIHEQLTRIAAILGLPPEAFYGQPTTPAAAARSTTPDVSEVLELLKLFDAITDPAERRACLVFVRAAAERGET